MKESLLGSWAALARLLTYHRRMDYSGVTPAPAFRSSAWLMVAAPLLAAVILFWLVLNNAGEADLWAMGGLAITVVEVLILRASAGGYTVSMVPVVISNTLICLGALFWEQIAPHAAVSARLSLPESSGVAAVQIVLAYTAVITFIAILTQTLGPARQAGTALPTLRISPGPLLLAGYLPLFVLMLGKGTGLIYLTRNTPDPGPHWASVLGGSFSPVAVLALALVAFRPDTKKGLAWIGLAVWAAVFFAINTRRLALMPGLLLAGFLLSDDTARSRINYLRITLVVGATLYLNQMVLVLRGTPTGYGLSPFLQRLIAEPGQFLRLDLPLVSGNLLFATPLTATVAQHQLPPGSFATSVSPLPSSLNGWHSLAQLLRVNGFTPFNGLGELAAHGWPFLIGFAVSVGLMLPVMERSIRDIEGPLRVVGMALLVALVVMFSVIMLQYNLRSGTRLLYYLAIVTVGLRIFSKMWQSRGALSTAHPDASTSRASRRSSMTSSASWSARRARSNMTIS
jgi:hypothetical protein